MRRSWFTAALAVVGAAVLSPVAGAAAPVHEEFTLNDVTFPDAYLSSACGFTVLDTVSGRLTGTLFAAQGTEPAHEVDTLTGGRITYSAPDSGNAVTRPLNGSSHTVYPEGTAVGAPAVVTITGVNGASFTGTAPPGTGQLVANATILFVDDAGIPGTAFSPSDIVSANGNYAASTSETCAALT